MHFILIIIAPDGSRFEAGDYPTAAHARVAGRNILALNDHAGFIVYDHDGEVPER